MKKLIPVLLSLSMSATAYAYDCPTSATVGGGYVPEICQTSPASDLAADSAIVVNVNKKEIDDASGVGAAIGAVTGGVVGNKVTGKKNKTLGTVLGAVAGGVAGHYGEKYLKKKGSRVIGCNGGIEFRSRTNEWVHINPNGDLFICCADYNFETVFGNVNSTSLKNIWSSRERQEMIKKSYSDMCTKCSAAIWG